MLSFSVSEGMLSYTEVQLLPDLDEKTPTECAFFSEVRAKLSESWPSMSERFSSHWESVSWEPINFRLREVLRNPSFERLKARLGSESVICYNGGQSHRWTLFYVWALTTIHNH